VVTSIDLVAVVADRIAEPVSLGVARIGTDGQITGSKLNLGDDAADAFREHCRAAVDAIESGTQRSYASGAELANDEFFVIDDRETLDELAVIGDLRTSIETMPVIKPADLDLSIQFYGIFAGADDRVLFVRRTDPSVSHRGGRFLAIGRERLTRVGDPAFSFSARFDFIMGDGWVVVLDQRAFEMVFRQVGLVEKNVSRWIEGITRNLPMDDSDIDQLRKVALQDSRTWRRLREIEQRGHLADVTLDQVRTYATLVGLDPDTVVAGDRLTFDPAQRFSFLHLLNEDLYKGQLTDQLFEAERKSAAAP
jgi:Kiwa protein KwaB-like